MAVFVPFILVGEISLLIRQQLLHSPEGLNYINFILLAKLMSHWLTFYPSLESRRRFLGSGCLKRQTASWWLEPRRNRSIWDESTGQSEGRVRSGCSAPWPNVSSFSIPILCFASPKLGMRSTFCSWNCVWKSLPSVSLPYTSLFYNNQNTSRLKAQ